MFGLLLAVVTLDKSARPKAAPVPVYAVLLAENAIMLPFDQIAVLNADQLLNGVTDPITEVGMFSPEAVV